MEIRHDIDHFLSLVSDWLSLLPVGSEARHAVTLLNGLKRWCAAKTLYALNQMVSPRSSRYYRNADIFS